MGLAADNLSDVFDNPRMHEEQIDHVGACVRSYVYVYV